MKKVWVNFWDSGWHRFHQPGSHDQSRHGGGGRVDRELSMADMDRQTRIDAGNTKNLRTTQGFSWRVTDREAQSVRNYQDGSDVNIELRARAPGASISTDAQELDSALAKTKLPQMKVYRSVDQSVVLGGRPPGSLSSDEPHVSHDRGFTSTFTHYEHAVTSVGGNDVIMEIDVPFGSRGGFLPAVGHSTGYEDEVLLPRGSQVTLTGSRVDRTPYGDVTVLVGRVTGSDPT